MVLLVHTKFCSFRAQIDLDRPVDPGTSYTAVILRGAADIF